MMNQNEAFEPFMLESNAKNTQVSFKAKNLRSRERKKKIFSILIVFLILIIIGVCIIFDHIYLRKVAQQRINTSNSTKNEITTQPLLKNRTKTQLTTNKTKICESEACKNSGKYLLSSINQTIDPCDDFYQFSCGGWIWNHQIKKDKPKINNMMILDEKLQEDIKKQLNKEVDASDSKSVAFAKQFFKSCLDEETLEIRGFEPLLNALNSIGGWPIVNNTNYIEDNYSWQNALAKVAGVFNLNPILGININQDTRHSTTHIIYLEPPTLGLERHNLVNTTSNITIIKAYRDLILSSVLLLRGEKYLTPEENEIISREVEQIIQFEQQLAKCSTSLEESHLKNISYRKNFTLLNDKANKTIDLLNLINQIYVHINSSIRVNGSEILIVKDIYFLDNMINLMKKTPKRVVANYIGWRLTKHFGHFTTAKFRSNVFEFNKIINGINMNPPFNESCLDYIRKSMENIVSRIYIDGQKNVPNCKSDINAMIHDLKKSFRELVVASDWLDQQTRENTLQKLDKMIPNVGYPDWIMSNSELDKYYDFKKVAYPEKAFENMLYIEYNNGLKSFEKLRKPVNRTMNWSGSAVVNAYYYLLDNTINIPAGILNNPFFDSKRPAYMNYAAIGFIIGHEITHGFDNDGARYDEAGNFKNWWSDHVKESFVNRSKCLIEQYSNYYFEEAELNLNGLKSVEENIADNGGLREAFQAYRKFVDKNGVEERLPFIEQYSPEQVFFMSYANIWCQRVRPEEQKQLIRLDTHSPGKFRVNIPLSNLKEFSEVFACKLGTKLNPIEKCIVW